MDFTTVAPNAAQLEEAYGGWNHSLLDMISFQVSRQTGTESEYYVHRIYSNGLLMPVPCDAESCFTEVEIREIFSKALARTIESQQLACQGSILPECLKRSMDLAEELTRPAALM
ncbi:MAG: hypothetical protein CMK74_03470 [Pseudomonadales bacterium]|nr:hypothetical protein [Pseudomonadales bacterium]|tara:strand:+ start:78 stop:422 length:345 start_codon:yes stop_codon:yes gene_type:complete